MIETRRLKNVVMFRDTFQLLFIILSKFPVRKFKSVCRGTKGVELSKNKISTFFETLILFLIP